MLFQNKNNTDNINSRQFTPFAGLWSGLGEFLNGDEYTPYINSSWKGNGLANTSIGYLRNPNYRDYFSAGQALAGLSGINKDKNKFQLQNVLGNLSGLGGRVGGYFHNRWEDLINNRFGDKGDVYVPIDANILGADRIA